MTENCILETHSSTIRRMIAASHLGYNPTLLDLFECLTVPGPNQNALGKSCYCSEKETTVGEKITVQLQKVCVIPEVEPPLHVNITLLYSPYTEGFVGDFIRTSPVLNIAGASTPSIT